MKIRKIHNNLKAIFLSGFLLVFLGANAQYISTEDSIAIAKERARGSIMPRTSNRPASPNANSISVNRDAAIVTYTPAELVEKIFLKSQGGDCATEGVIEDVTLHALNWTGTAWSTTSPEYNRSMSYFSGGQTTGTRVLGVESGILLTTGPGLYAEGPNGSGSGAQSALNGGKTLSDADLQALTTNGINCGTVLEFTFTPQSSQISFEYVFGSEEYPNYSNNQTYNDVFGFFISDEDGVSNKRNIAIVPGTTDLPVAIYNVNQLRNTEYFVNCYTTAGQQVEYNGHTTVLTAKANVEPGKKYRLKLAIANVGDSSYGSGVFLKAGSFDLGLGITNHGNEIQGMDNVFQACESNKFTLKINKSSVARTIAMTYSGAALNFIKQPDGSNMPATINVPAYSTEVSVPYKVLSTVSTNGGDFNIKATIPGCGEITKTIYVYQQFLSATVKTTPSCNGNDGSLYVEAAGGSPRVEMSRNGGGDWQKIAVPFTGLAPGNYTVLVRDSIGCNTETLTAVVTGKPVINNTFTETTVCAGTIVPKVALTSTVAGTTYVWTCNNSAIGLTSGTGDIPQFTAKNTTTGQLEATITVTPTAFGCVGVSKSYKIIVNPVAGVKPISNLTVCNNSQVSSIPFETTAMPTNKVTYTWKNNNAAIGLVASGSGSNLPSFTAVNSGTAPVTATIEVTPKYEDCIGTPLSFTITVNPTAVVKPITNLTVCNNSQVPSIPFETTATPSGKVTYTWKNSNTAIGLVASGTGSNLPSFTAVNPGTTPITATIEVTPKYEDCISTPLTFTITVNPTAIVKPITNLTVCNNSLVSSIPFETTATPTNKVTYTWKNSNSAIGLVASGTGSTLPSFTAINPSTAPVTATIEVTPKYEDCIGTPLTFTITVNPTAIVKPITNLTVCNNNQVLSIPFETTATPSGKVTYTWKNSNTAIGLAASGSGSVLPSFTATNSTNSPITAVIEVTPKYENCEGTKLTFTITVNAPVMAGTIKGNPFVCENQNPLEIKEITAASGGSNSFTYQWKYSTDGVIWTDIPGANNISYTPGLLTVDTHFKRMTIDGFCGQQFESNTFTIKVMAQPTTLYWKSTAGDSNWNNPDNWVDKDGNQLGMVPLACTDVQITGGSANYPSLDLVSTPVDLYGAPQCKNITFQYGSEVAYQHKLAYEKAFVQYNWGYYSSTSGLTEGTQPDKNGSGSPCLVKERDTWYALAAPLKNMASGDFSFGGFPVTWQGGFNIQDPVTGQSVEVEAGDFSKAYARNDINLAETNNAVAIKVPSYKDQVGYNNHCHMDGLEGVLEFPYFENETKAPFYPAHTYDKFTGESKFFYFDTKTLQLIYSPVGQMKRGSEAYRFIYETSSNEVKNINIGGNSVPGYAQEISKHIATSQKVMVGNPFMASINSKRFLDANNIDPIAPKLLVSDGYFVFNSTLQIWENRPFSATNNIKPQQAFIVTLAEGVNSTELLYPFEGTYALTGPAFRGLSQVLPEGSSLYLKTSDNNDMSGDYAILNASWMGNIESNVKKMIYTEGHIVPETFFITPDGNDYNLVQAIEEGVKEIGIGVKCSDTQKPLKFTFENVSEFYSTYGVRPVLVDKFMSIEQDLTDNDTYHFNQRKTTVENKYIDADRFVLRMASPGDIVGSVNDGIHIVYQNGVLDVKSDRIIKTVHVYDLYGRLIHSNRQINTTVYTKSLSLAQGLYIVKVRTEDGKTKVEKIMAL
ncbi:choice-of-anchor L domain-containing protein [Dysgonomonas gadei]|uniref:PKD-like domain-containing protein n=1 Tax=Dysgonomonas gadei ATCC BAA-286 TaxID=742766 RepID=F5ITE7_9BACT|nr:choice-of-anchor L domain-containing protein [Dysgonomonas gadei]EGJ99331.1 hypothetical protein HMPREF9455_00364 [Dysgonomonas gadei ATCC BAA-286]